MSHCAYERSKENKEKNKPYISNSRTHEHIGFFASRSVGGAWQGVTSRAFVCLFVWRVHNGRMMGRCRQRS